MAYCPGAVDRCIAHVDMDAFYVSVELRRRPELRGRPVIVAGTGPRAVVTTASYEARRFGVGSAMPAARARRLCPDGIYLPPDFAYYREASRQVMALVRDCSDTVEVIGLDEAYLDLSGLPAPHAEMRRLVRRIAGDTELHCSIGIGPNKLVAKVASDAEKPRGFVILTRDQARERFARSPCGLIPGIGPKTAERLQRAGLHTLGRLAAAPSEQLTAQFGARFGAALQSRARFEDDSPVTEARKVVSESRETTFDYDIAEPAALEEVLERLTEQLCSALERQERRGRTIGIKVRLDDFSTHTRARTLAEPVASADRVLPVALELLRRFAAPRPVRLLGVRVAGLEPAQSAAVHQLTLALEADARASRRSVERCGEAAARVAGEWVIDAELVQDPDHDAADIVLGAVGGGQRPDEEIERLLLVAGVQGGKGVAEVVAGLALLERDPGGQPIGGEAPGHLLQQGQGAVAVATVVEDPRERHRCIGARGLQRHRTAQRCLVPLRHQVVSLGGHERVQECVDGGERLGADELGDHAPVAEGLDRRDALDAEVPRHGWVGVDVDLGELDLALAGGHGALQQWSQLPAGAAPFRPEIDDDRDGARALDDG